MSNFEFDPFAFAKAEQSPSSSPLSEIDIANMNPAQVIREHAIPRVRSYRQRIQPSDVDYMSRQLGYHDRGFDDMELLLEPHRREKGGGTVRAYIASNSGLLTGDIAEDTDLGCPIGLFVDHDSFDKTGGTTFFHIFPYMMYEIGGASGNYSSGIMSGIQTAVELGSFTDVRKHDEYANYREMIGATCSVVGC